MKLDGVLDALGAPWREGGVTLISKLVRTKDLRGLQGESQKRNQPKLTKCLGTLDLTSLGVGSCCGTGMYLVAGMVAKTVAGPGVVISFLIAALASLFSGVCYAEFGVRVPHTSGSAYMYSYVTVGEFVAFVIGWNMVLEYLIGTSACACALSASFDSLSGGAISRGIAENIGTIFGRAPDFVALGITLMMTCVLALGASKSVLFNHALNALNLATWTFAMGAGLFYADTTTWTEHEGFLPFGWGGVFKGAATCFYAFIGFDIIATTGEEATNPQRSIPRAIIASLIIVLIAYISSSLVLTLVVPYDQIDPGSALVQMFGQVGAWQCRAIVGAGAAAGLGVAMFGSMFPMPRVIYAMASDGLIFKSLAQIWSRTGTPGIATIGSGIAAGLVALLVRLEVLVEMMSIGTLLAYTLVSTCVLILRYQPHSTSLVELLPEVLRTPQPPATPAIPEEQDIPLELTPRSATNIHTQKVMVRRVTRSSPDSDDTFSGEAGDGIMGGGVGDFSMRDDQFLVADRSENKFYGSVHGGSTTGNPSNVGGAFSRYLQAASYLCPALFPWVNPGPATHDSGMYVVKLVGIMYALILIMDITAAVGSGAFAGTVITLAAISIVAVLLIISKQPQNRHALAFLTPCLPVVPAIAITVNIYLILKLSVLTLVRFTVWMSLGLIMYFYYGISHSSLENPEVQDITVENTNIPTVQTSLPPGSGSHGYTNQMEVYDLNTAWGEPNYSYNNQYNPGAVHYDNRGFEGSHFGVIGSNPGSVFTNGNTNSSPFPTWDD